MDYLQKVIAQLEGIPQEWQNIIDKGTKDGKTDWVTMSAWEDLSEDFIREMKDYVDWEKISTSQDLSEDFIREMGDYVDWKKISFAQKLSEDFIREFQDRIDFKLLLHNTSFHLSKDFIEEFQDKYDPDEFESFDETGWKEKIKEYAKQRNLDPTEFIDLAWDTVHEGVISDPNYAVEWYADLLKLPGNKDKEQHYDTPYDADSGDLTNDILQAIVDGDVLDEVVEEWEENQ